MAINRIKGGNSTSAPGMNLVNRQGQVVDKLYHDKKYKVLSSHYDYYSHNERIKRFCIAFFQVLFTLGFILCHKGKRTEIYDLFCASIKSETLNITRYTKNTPYQHQEMMRLLAEFRSKKSEGPIGEYTPEKSLEKFKQKCKEICYCINLDEWSQDEVDWFFATQNADCIEFLANKNKGKNDIAKLALRDMISNSLASLRSIREKEKKEEGLQRLRNIIKAFVNSGADLNQRTYDLSRPGKFEHVTEKNNTILSQIFCNLNGSPRWPLEEDILPIIAFLVSCGAKTNEQMEPSLCVNDKTLLRGDVDADQELLKTVMQASEAQPSLLTLLLSREDEESAFAVFPPEIVTEIAKRMLSS